MNLPLQKPVFLHLAREVKNEQILANLKEDSKGGWEILANLLVFHFDLETNRQTHYIKWFFDPGSIVTYLILLVVR